MKLTQTEIKALRSILKKYDVAAAAEPVSELPVSVVEPVKAAKTTKATTKARKVQVDLPSAKADRKAANKALYASINGHLGEATKCAGLGDTAGCVAALKTAMAKVPTHANKAGDLAWSGTVAQIVRKAESLGLNAKALA